MLLIISSLLRPLIIWIVQLGVTAAAVSVLTRVIEALVNWIREVSGASQADSEAYVTNAFVDALLFIGAGTAVLKSKLPIAVAKKIGLANATPTKVAVSTAGAEKIKAVSAAKATSTFTKYFKPIAGVLLVINGLAWLANIPIQAIEPGIYKPKQTNDIWESILGVRPFPESDGSESPGSFSPADFSDYARSLETAGIKGIEYGFPKGTVLYSKDALAELIDYVTGIENGKGKPTTVAKIKPLLAPYLLGIGNTTTTPTKTTTSSTPALTAPTVKVFSGVLSQGTLGRGLEFAARPDDMIENAQELLDAAANNLAPWLTALASKVSYQVKIVSTVIGKDGFAQKGSVNQVISGYNKDGSPKYKTVVNKWAVLELYISNDKGVRTKLSTITLGPVDSVKLQVGQGTLTAVDEAIKKVATTTDINAVKQISSNSPVTVTTPTNTVPGKHFVIGLYGSAEVWDDTTLENIKRAYPNGPWREVTLQEWQAVPDKSYNAADPSIQTAIKSAAQPPTQSPVVSTPSFAPSTPSTPIVTTPKPVVTVPTPTTPKAGANAQTLFDWYAANGRSLPSLSERATLYQQYGLGQSSLYAGTAEQNTKLLTALKA